MEGVDERSTSAKFRAVCWRDPADIQRWFSAVEQQVDELMAAARDRVRKKRARVLSRYEGRRKIRAAVRAIGQLFEGAKAGFGPPELPSPSPFLPDEPAGAEPPLSERREVHPQPGVEGA